MLSDGTNRVHHSKLTRLTYRFVKWHSIFQISIRCWEFGTIRKRLYLQLHRIQENTWMAANTCTRHKAYPSRIQQQFCVGIYI